MGMIHDIAPCRYDNSYASRRPPRREDAALYYKGRQAQLLQEGDSWVLPAFAQLPDGEDAMREAEYLFSIDGQGFYLVPSPCAAPGFAMHDILLFREALPGCTAFAGITGWQLYRFKEEHRFCGKCASPLKPHPVDRAYACPGCGMVYYPKFSPAILALVTDGDRCLLVRSRQYKKNFSPVAGFVEVGETFEQAAAREVLEETGVRVKNVRYIQSQPWSFGDTIMIGFAAQLDGEPALCPQASEILEAGWFRRDEVEIHSLDSLGGQLLKMFREGLL